MQRGKVNVVIDAFFGSSGKGKISTYLARRDRVASVSSANYPNAGHTAQFAGGGPRLVAKALPTALVCNRLGQPITGLVTPGSGFAWARLHAEWAECGRPRVFVHERAVVVGEGHAARESAATRHIASTMQGSGAALCDKLMRGPDVPLARRQDLRDDFMASLPHVDRADFEHCVQVVDGPLFRTLVRNTLASGAALLHEGSQGYALSVDHGPEYPYCTARNCTTAAALDYLAVGPRAAGDVYLNVRTFPIRVGNVYAPDGRTEGYSGRFHPDSQETTWQDVAAGAGMPPEFAAQLAERERTTVTKRVRRVATFSMQGLVDAVEANGATRLCLSFPQYLDWSDFRKSGHGPAALRTLSDKTRALIDRIEQETNVPVTLVSTGPDNEDMIDNDD